MTSRWHSLVGVAIGAGLVLTAGCTSRPSAEPFFDPAPVGALKLVSFESCAEVTEQLRAAASAHVGPWGFGTGGEELAAAREGAPAAVPDAAAGAALDQDLSQAPAYSGTNVHEAGVDEPDLVKTDGRRIVTVTDGVLRVVDAARRVETGTLDLRGAAPDGDPWQAADLLLHGDRALVLQQQWWGGLPGQVDPDVPGSLLPDPTPIGGPKLLLVDLTPAVPRLVSTYTVDGGLVDARAVGSIARVVVRSNPRVRFPELPETQDQADRLAANRAAVEAAPLADWLPRYQVTTGDTTDTGQVSCTAVSRPASYSGTSMLSVLTFDLSAPGLGDGSPVSVVADGDTVYSNGTSLYVASDQSWRFSPDGTETPGGGTEIFKFDTSQPGPPRYTAAGAVDGWLLNQYAMSEWEGHLRVATTTAQFDPDSSESTVYVLAERDGALVVAGSVGNLGKTERIYSVRFVGPIGYVVTFRETDPLYTVDLRDPAAPAVIGELKITGYSAYLHPLGDGRLVGVGQEADSQGRIQGTQVSLFDVTDLAAPRLRGTHHIAHGYSEAELDPHAFLWWPAERLLVIPLTSEQRGAAGSGALVLRVEEAGFTALDTIGHPDGGQVRRTLVVGDTLWTVSDRGLQGNALSTLTQTAWIPFH